MTIRSITGSSISDAVQAARSVWGDSVVLLEAQPPDAGGEVRITVCFDSPSPRRGLNVVVADGPPNLQSVQAPPDRTNAHSVQAPPAGSLRRAHRGSGRLYAPLTASPDPERTASRRARTATAPLIQDAAETGRAPAAPRVPSSETDARTAPRPVATVFPRLVRDGNGYAPAPPQEADPTPFTVQAPEVAAATVSPLLSKLIRAGLRPSRAQRIACSDSPNRALVAELPPSFADAPPRRIAFLGKPGSGKTTTVIRTALSRLGAGGPAPFVLILQPTEPRSWLDPSVLYARHGLDCRVVDEDGLAAALADGSISDVLVDTPYDTVPAAWSRRSLHIRRVVDARTVAASAVGRSDSVVLTHCDGGAPMGHAVEALIEAGAPVVALINSHHPDRGARPYRPLGLARTLCHA